MFKSRKGQAQYLAAYEATLRLWPVPVDSFDVPTRFGSTHVNVCGRDGAPPVLLLHGIGISSTMWYPNVASLAHSYRLYALDTIGDAGKSICTRSLRTPSDFTEWLSDVFRALRLQKAHVVGLSYGGFLALNLALSEPDRVTKLVLLAPAACLLPFAPRFYLRFFLSALLPVRALRLSLMRSMFAMPIVKGTPVVEQFLMGKHFRGDYHVYPRVYSDDELRRVRAPTLLLLGEGEIIYDPRAALKRASLIPDVETAIVPGARHALTFDQPKIVNRRLLQFLGKAPASREGSKEEVRSPSGAA